MSFSQALLHHTKKLHLIAAILPGAWNPIIAAKQLASIDQYTGGRIAVNVVSGWFKGEFTAIGQHWLEHDERYRRSEEFIRVLRGAWSQDKVTFKGDFYQTNEWPLRPQPINKHIEVFQGGNSQSARAMASRVSDWYFMNGQKTLADIWNQVHDVKALAKEQGRQVKTAINGFVIIRETEEEALKQLAEIVGQKDEDAVKAFGDAVQQAGKSASGGKGGMWSDANAESLVQYNEGFRTKLIGTPEQVADRILLLKSLGIDLVLTAYLHFQEEVDQFGKQVIPLVRKLEAEGRGKDARFEIQRSGDVYELGEFVDGSL